MNGLLLGLAPVGACRLVFTNVAAQNLTCAVTDAQCFQLEFENFCRKDSTIESCAEWLRSIEQSPQSIHPNVQLAAAAANVALSDLTGGPVAKTPYRQRATELYSTVADRDPTNVRALLGLAGLVDSRDQKIELMRRVVDLDPGNVMNLEMLSILIGTGGAQTDLVEAAEISERAYELRPNGTKRWSIAADVILKYEAAALKGRAEVFRVRARAAIDPDDMLRVTTEASDWPPERVKATVQQLCTFPIISVIGPESCLEAARNVVDAADAAPTPNTSESLADTAVEAMMIAAGNAPLLDSVDPDWRTQFEAATDRFLSMQSSSPLMYVNAAAITNNREKRIAVMEVASDRFPTDADVAFALGLAHLDQSNKTEAIDALTRAQALLPEDRRSAVNQFLKRASELPD